MHILLAVLADRYRLAEPLGVEPHEPQVRHARLLHQLADAVVVAQRHVLAFPDLRDLISPYAPYECLVALLYAVLPPHVLQEEEGEVDGEEVPVNCNIIFTNFCDLIFTSSGVFYLTSIGYFY